MIVLATILGQVRGEKLIVYKFKAKKRYRRKTSLATQLGALCRYILSAFRERTH